MVSFLLGKGNLDISDMVRAKIAELVKSANSDSRIIYIVPDQFESETEYAVYEILKKNDLRSKSDTISITPFSELAEELLSENGDNRPRADDVLKSVVMHKAVSELKKAQQLSVLERISDKQGFCEKISETVNGFKSAGIGTIELEEKIGLIENSDDNLKNAAVFKKLGDVSKIYTQYDQIIKSKNYIDSLDMIGLSADLIHKSAMFDNADVFVDCFNDFTNDQLHFLCEIIPKANNVTFGFVTDIENESDVFKTANLHISRLERCAKENGEETNYITTGFNGRYTNSALENIPKKLYQDYSGERVETDSCELVSAPSIFAELDFVCAKIKELIETRNIRYNNIAVLCTDLSGCGRYIESTFRKYDIPFFLDMRESILIQPLINAVLTLINSLRDFSLERVLGCIKTGFFTKLNDKNERVGLTEYDIGVFEDYVFEWALNTSHLQQPFTFTSNPDGIDKKTEIAENIRQSVAEPLYNFCKKLKKEKTHNGAELTKEIYEYLINTVGIKHEIEAKCYNDNESALMYQRLWDTLIRIINALCKELQDVNVTINEYYEIFRDVCLSTTLANPPQMVDSVLVGDIDRTRAANIKAAFIIEATFDAFPAPVPKIGIFSQYETDLIHEYFSKIDAGSYLKSSSEQYQLALYRAYRAVCLPTDYLCVSYSEQTLSGEEMQISPVSEEIEKLFTAPNNNSVKKSTAEFNNEFFCRSVNSAKLRFALGLNSGSRENEVLRLALDKQGEECHSFVSRLKQLKYERDNPPESVSHNIKPEIAQLLFPRRFGATVVEKIAKCKFNYFCEYGLNVKEREQRTFSSLKRGVAIHFVLEKVLREFSSDIEKFCLLRRGELFALSKKYITEYYENETNNSPLSDSRNHFLFVNIANAATDTLISMQMEFCSRKYRPKLFELDLSRTYSETLIDNDREFTAVPNFKAELFEETAEIPESPPKCSSSDITINIAPLTLNIGSVGNIEIHGKIDRVDMFKSDNKIYARVVDYKSSAHSFDLENAKRGINIQMLMYLSALIDANKANGLVAGGISYVPTENIGAVGSVSDPTALIALNRLSSGLLVVDSVTQSDYENYQKYITDHISDSDSKEEAKKKLTCCHISDNNRDSAKAAIKTADPSEFNDLQSKVFTGISKRFEEIFNGKVDASPLVYSENFVMKNKKTVDSCEYCRFKSICKYGDGESSNENGGNDNYLNVYGSSNERSDNPNG